VELRAVVPEQEHRLGDEGERVVLLLERAAVGHGNVDPAVEVEVEEGASPPDHVRRDLSKVELAALVPILEAAARHETLIQGVLLGDPVREEEVRQAVRRAGHVAGLGDRQPHRRPRVRGAGARGEIGEPGRAARTELARQAAEEPVRRDIVVDVEVEPAVAVEIDERGGQAPARSSTRRRAATSSNVPSPRFR
jgi:hypothetical protein